MIRKVRTYYRMTLADILINVFFVFCLAGTLGMIAGVLIFGGKH